MSDLRARSVFVLLLVALFSLGAGCSSGGTTDGGMSNGQVRDWYNAQVARLV